MPKKNSNSRARFSSDGSRKVSGTIELKSNKEKVKSISYFKLFKFSTRGDKIRIAFAIVTAVAAGAANPMVLYLVAYAINDMIAFEKNQSTDKDFMSKMGAFSIKMCCVGCVVFLGIFVSSALINVAAINQVFRIKGEYLKAVLNQDFNYFDTRQIGEFASRMTENIQKLEEGIGDKLTIATYFATGGIACIILSLIQGWKLALLCLLSSPISFMLVGLVGKFAHRLTKLATIQSGEASDIAEETISSIRTVFAFNGQQKEIDRYSIPLAKTRKIDIKKEAFTGLAMALLFFCIFSSYGLSFYLGIYLTVHDPMHYNVGVMFAVFMGVMTGLQMLGFLGTVVVSFASARGAGATIFSVIFNKPTINPLVDRGLKPDSIEGNIEFRDVYFRYPSRPETPVLKGLSLKVNHGQSVALVGPSGCGKSTVLQLISRYYEIDSGKVSIDGIGVEELSVRWLRSHIGLVSQEPVLFNTTVRENIRYGRKGATDLEIEAVAQQANAHVFIMKLPKGYDTLVGERGASLSGGQKQRIAIARALLRNPPILILDEATSALDASSEVKVQNALDKASAGRTTLIVAHRLSTIRNVDFIYVLKDGIVVEQGSHAELVAKKGLFYNMLNIQQPSILKSTEDSKKPKKDIDVVSLDSETVYDNSQSLPRNIQSSEKHLILSKLRQEAEREAKPAKMTLRRLLALNAPEWKVITLGCVSSVITGFAMPMFFLVFGHVIGAMATKNSSELMDVAIHVSLASCGIGVIVGTSNLVEAISFGIAGSYLTERLRFLMFSHLMKQDIAFFDDQANSTGALCARLASEAARVQAATGQRIGTILQAAGSIGLAITLAFYFEYRIALLELAFVPLFSVVIYYQTKIAIEESTADELAAEKSTKIAIEAVQNVRTVAALGRQPRVVEEYIAELRPALNKAYKSAYCRAVVAGCARSMLTFVNSTTLILGAHLLTNNETKSHYVMIATQVLNMAANLLQSVFTYYPEFQKGLTAASRVKAILDKKPVLVEPAEPYKNFISNGDANLQGVHFRYPTRPGISVLRGLNLDIESGKMLALVGESGCGKSTVISLLQRFYDPESGVVSLSGVPLVDLLFKDVRASFGLVPQEPVLFKRSVAENIAYGDNTRAVSMEEITAAAMQANIHDFIVTMPQGYESNIGAKGVQLSGGQKQRIAIARALVRKPKILLLDEATSALDTESEKVVQEALDRAKEGRTCVTIAHRLSTIRDADAICVLKRGILVERGTHDQLIQKKGLYYDLYNKGT